MKPQIKTKPLTIIMFTALLFCILIFLKTNSTETIPYEDPQTQKKLDKVIALSKFNTDQAIEELKNLNDLPEYTNYKKNYILARLYEKENKPNEAIAIYEKLQDKNYPLKERAIFHLANLNAIQNNDKEALKYFNKLLRDFPNSKSTPQAKYYLAQTQLRLRFTNQAINTLLSLRTEYPNTQFGIATNYYLGELAYNKKTYDKAIKYWRQYLELSPDGRFANDIANFLTDVSLKTFLKSYDYSLLGDVFFHKKDYKNAAQYYKIGDASKKYYELGYSLYRINNKTEAQHYLKEFAYRFPKSKNAKWALYYASSCMPSYMRKPFFSKITKDIPELAYYTIYKEGFLEDNKRRKIKILSNLIDLYPNGEFTHDAIWEIMWQKINDKNYTEAEKMGNQFFEISKSQKGLKLETRAKIGFWLGKIAEITKQPTQAIEYYKQTQNILFDNYYSIRANNRLLALTGQHDPLWKQQNNINNFNDYTWSIPRVLKSTTIKSHFGATVAELINLQQFDEAIDLIGTSQSPTKRITSWLKALNSEYETSINIANSITTQYHLSSNSNIWKLAYPLYFWEYISNTCKKYSVDPLLACALIRQESRFDTNALSVSNAYGLMQLIKPTAKTQARELNINLNSLEQLKDPKTNISLGINYLEGLFKLLNNPLFAIASYNAGPQAVKSWINNFNSKDLDFFIEEIPYDQTKNYVKKVFASYWTYLKLYKKS